MSEELLSSSGPAALHCRAAARTHDDAAPLLGERTDRTVRRFGCRNRGRLQTRKTSVRPHRTTGCAGAVMVFHPLPRAGARTIRVSTQMAGGAPCRGDGGSAPIDSQVRFSAPLRGGAAKATVWPTAGRSAPGIVG